MKHTQYKKPTTDEERLALYAEAHALLDQIGKLLEESRIKMESETAGDNNYK